MWDVAEVIITTIGNMCIHLFFKAIEKGTNNHIAFLWNTVITWVKTHLKILSEFYPCNDCVPFVF